MRAARMYRQGAATGKHTATLPRVRFWMRTSFREAREAEWRWGESNPRPEHFHACVYTLSTPFVSPEPAPAHGIRIGPALLSSRHPPEGQRLQPSRLLAPVSPDGVRIRTSQAYAASANSGSAVVFKVPVVTRSSASACSRSLPVPRRTHITPIKSDGDRAPVKDPGDRQMRTPSVQNMGTGCRIARGVLISVQN